MFNDKSQLVRRRDLRKNSTQQEVILWSRLKRSQLGVKFRRQFGIGPYIVDFYSPERRFVIEIDGSHHHDTETLQHDIERTVFLESKGCFVLRFTNAEINTNISGVLQAIQERILLLS